MCVQSRLYEKTKGKSRALFTPGTLKLTPPPASVDGARPARPLLNTLVERFFYELSVIGAPIYRFTSSRGQ
eukprot:1937521-Prymnesium_polylepis.1